MPMIDISSDWRAEPSTLTAPRPIPVVGQTVHFYDRAPDHDNSAHLVGPFAAIVTRVLRNPMLVDLAVLRPGATVFEVHRMIPNIDEPRMLDPYWTWAGY